MLEIVFWFTPLVVSIGSGGAVKSNWAVLAGPALALLAGAIVTALEPPNYDMHGFGIFLGVVLAVVCVVVWLIARGFRLMLARRAA